MLARSRSLRKDWQAVYAAACGPGKEEATDKTNDLKAIIPISTVAQRKRLRCYRSLRSTPVTAATDESHSFVEFVVESACI